MDNDLLIIWGTLPWLFFLVVVLSYDGKDIKHHRLNMLFWFAFIFAAVRYGIGYDYFSYKYLIEGYGRDYEIERFEFLSRYLAVISGKTHYQLFFAVSSLLTIWPVYYVCKKISQNPLYSFVVYLLFPMFYLDGLGIVRNAVAFSMVLLMFYCIYRKKILLSIVPFLIAMGFHASTIVALLIYPLYYFFHNRNANIALYLSSFMISLVIMPLLLTYFTQFDFVSKITNNIDKEITRTGGILYYIINFVAVLNFIFWNKLKGLNELNKIYLSLINVGVVVWNIFLSSDPTTAQRLSVFFLIFIVLLAPSYLCVFKQGVPRFLFKTFFVLMFISSVALNYRAYYELRRNMSIIPYQVFFLSPSDAFHHIY